MTTKIDGDHAVAKIKPGTHVKVLGPDGNVQDEFTADRNLVVVKTEEFKKAVAGYLRLLDELQSVLFNVRELILEEQEAVGQDELDEATEINARWYKFFSDEVVPRVSAARPRK